MQVSAYLFAALLFRITIVRFANPASSNYLGGKKAEVSINAISELTKSQHVFPCCRPGYAVLVGQPTEPAEPAR